MKNRPLKNLSLRLMYQKQYATIATQSGKVSAIFDRALDEPDLDKAIADLRSARGHVAVALKALHEVRQNETLFKSIK